MNTKNPIKKKTNISNISDTEKQILEDAIKSTSIYCTPIFLDSSDPKNIEGGSGTFITTQDKFGILTNSHVAEIFKGYNTVKIPDSKENEFGIHESISIGFEKIQHFHCPEVDMAFIRLTKNSKDMVLKKLNKKFFNLDNSKKNYPDHIKTKIGSIFIIHGAVREGHNYNIGQGYVKFKNFSPYVVDPKLKENNIECEITAKDFPKDFSGMSGAALWQIVVNKEDKIANIILLGIATKQNKNDKEIICYGPNKLYNIVYPQFNK